jgi:hypothetical protein
MSTVSTPGSGRAYLSESAALGYESVAVSTTAIGLTASTYGSADVAIITVEDANVRFRTDGTAPTTSEGHIAYVGDVITLRSQGDIANFSAIRDDAVDAALKVSFS